MYRPVVLRFLAALLLLLLSTAPVFAQSAPTITSFTPTFGLTGAVIAVSGTGFTGATGAAVNGINAVYAVQNDSLIDICVPSDTSSGPIAVTTSGGTATSSTSFTLLAGVGIGDISPDDGATGQSINIYGDDFNGVTSVTFGGVPAAFTYVNWYRIIAIVPQGFSSGTVTVTTPQGAATSWQSFTVYSPIITAISPNSGSAGTVINLTGTGFTGVTAGSVGGVSAPFSVVSSTSVNVTAPTGVISGPVSLTAHGFPTTSAANFIVATPSFLLSTSTPASTIGQNSIATSIISLTNEDGFTGSVALSISGLPSGVSASFLPSTISGSTVSTLTLTSNSSITAGSDFLTVTGTSGSMVETVPIDFISTATNSTLTAVEVAPPTASISTPGTQQFTATGLDQFGNVLGTQPTFTWTLETSPIGSISSTGLYTASAVGTDTVTATSGSLHASATTTVTEGPPTITSFTPTSGTVGTVIAVTGTNLAGATAVTVNGIGGVIVVQSNTLADVVATGSTGPIRITTPEGTATSLTNFTVLPGVGIAQINPNSGAILQRTNIWGQFFSGVNGVSFNGVPAAFTFINADNVTAIVPPGATSGPVTIATPTGSAIAWPSFTVVGPIISSISPASGAAGTVVTLTGTGLTSASSASIGGVSASLTVVSSTDATVTVPSGAVTGPVCLTSSYGTCASPTAFTVPVPSFTISTTPAMFTLGAGTTGTITLNVANIDGFSSDVSVTVSGLPAGVTATVSPSTLSGSGTATLTLTAAPSITTAFTTLTVTGTSGSLVQTTPVCLATVTSSTLTSIALSPAAASIPSGSTQQFMATGLDQYGNMMGNQPSFTWSLESSSTGSVSSTGLYTASGAATDTVTATSGSVSASTTITVTEGPPTITSFTPTSGTVGTVIAVTGTNLAGAAAVTVNGIGGVIVVQSNTLADVVATGSTGPIRITTPEGTATSPTNFTVLPGVGIAQINPNSGAILQRTNIWGQFFSGVNGVSFNGVPAAFTFINADNVTAIVPPGATSGPVTIATPTGSAIAWPSFTVVGPIISSISPASGAAGTVVTLTGTGLTSASSASIGGVSAPLTVVSSTDATVTVPSGAVTGPVCLTSSYGTCASPTPFTVPVPSFTISTTPAMFTLGAGTTGTITLNVANIDGFSSNVSVTVSGLPAGVTATVSPSTLSGSGTATLTLTAAPSITTAFTTLTVTGTSGSLVQTTPVCLATVTSSTLTAIALSPAAAAIPNGTTQQFAATALDQYGNALGTQPTFTWSLESSPVGSISTSGLYTAVTVGTDTVTAHVGSVVGSATVAAINPAPPAPTGLAATPGDGQNALTWNTVTGATSYNLYQAVGSGTPTLYQVGLTANSFTDIGLSDGTTYIYAVTAVNVGGESSQSSQVSATPEPLAPAAPTCLSAAPGNAQVSLYWSPAYEAATYNVYRGTSPGGESVTPIATGVTGASYADGSAANGTAYYYTVTAVNVTGASAQSNEASGAPESTLLSAPTNLTVVPGDTTNALTWTSVAGATSYNIYQFTDDGDDVDGPYANTTSTSFTDTGLTDGTTYYYVVTAVNASDEGPSSNEAYGTPEPPPPAATTGLSAVAGNTEATLSWTASTGTISYNVYRATSSGAEGMTPYATGVTDTTFTDSGLTNGTTYYYTVTAVGDGGEGAQSSEASVRPLGSILWAPADLNASPEPNSVSLFWFPSAGAATYNLYRATTSGSEGSVPYQTGLTSSEYTDSAVTNGTTYYYTVAAVSGSIVSSVSDESSATPEAAPLAPTALAAAGGILQTTLSWTAPTSGADTYNIYRAEASGQEGSIPLATGVTAPAFADTDPALTPGQIYYYEVTAVLNGVEGAPSNEASATPTAPAPSAPTIYSAAPGNAQIALAWSPTTYATTYNVYRGTSSGGESTTPIASGLSSPSYTDTSVSNGTPYFYTVVAVGAGGTSAPSAEAVAAPYAAPTGLSVIPGDVETLLTWSPVAGASTNGGGYIVYRSTTSGGPYTQVNGTLISGGAAYLDTNNDTGLITGSTYYYVVAYLDGYGNLSAQSAQSSGTTVASAGNWAISVAPTVASSAPSTGTTAYSSASTNYTTALASAGSAGPVSVDTPETATASATGPWTAIWVPNSPSAVPGLYVIDEVQSQSLNDQVVGEGDGDASVGITSGLSLATVDPATAVALPGLPVVTDTIDTSTSGVVNFGFGYALHTLTLTQTGSTTTAYVESNSNTIHYYHVYTPLYFAANFASGATITLTFNTSNASITASSDAPPGTASGVGWSASGLVSDLFSNYFPGGN